MDTAIKIEIDNSSAALFVKNWMKQDNPRLDPFQLEQKWWQHREYVSAVISVKSKNDSRPAGNKK